MLRSSLFLAVVAALVACGGHVDPDAPVDAPASSPAPASSAELIDEQPPEHPSERRARDVASVRPIWIDLDSDDVPDEDELAGLTYR